MSIFERFETLDSCRLWCGGEGRNQVDALSLFLCSAVRPGASQQFAMAYSLQGCGLVLKSDIEKRDRDYAKFGRTAADPVVSSLFIHSVYNVSVRAGSKHTSNIHRPSRAC
jgi:hypothetical protein